MGWLESIEREISKGLSAVGNVVGGIAGGVIDVAQGIGGQLLQQLPGAIAGAIIPQPNYGTPGIVPGAVPGYTPPVFTPGGAPTTRVPEPFVAPSVSMAEFSLPRGATMPGNVALPGGAPVQAGLGTDLLGLGLQTAGPGLIERGFNYVFGGGEAGMANGMQLFRPTATSIRPARVIVVPHPQTGAPVFFGHLGRPLLFSRDLSAARRVDRLARRARRVRRGR